MPYQFRNRLRCRLLSHLHPLPVLGDRPITVDELLNDVTMALPQIPESPSREALHDQFVHAQAKEQAQVPQINSVGIEPAPGRAG